jgi:hypothetical protein
MAYLSVPAIYNGSTIELLEAAPVHEPYRVLVTFIAPEAGEEQTKARSAAWADFLSTFGVWQDDPLVEATLDDIHSARISKAEPASL